MAMIQEGIRGFTAINTMRLSFIASGLNRNDQARWRVAFSAKYASRDNDIRNIHETLCISASSVRYTGDLHSIILPVDLEVRIISSSVCFPSFPRLSALRLRDVNSLATILMISNVTEKS